MKVVVVELPAKAKTINKYLGSDYKVVASYGHVRDLPAKDGSVLPDADFAMSWEVDGKSEKHLKTIVQAMRGADGLFLATDPDREGEAISWHVQEVLKSRRALKDVDVKRVVFNEVTRNAVVEAFRRPREIDRELVEAYLARRALDYLVGFTLSPVLWRKLPGSRSAGRVQSVALRLICEREAEIEAFKSREYWTVEVDFTTEAGQSFTARLTHLDGKRLDRFELDTEAKARAAADAILRASGFAVAEIESRQVRRNPFPPFTTSTLQQEASRKLGLRRHPHDADGPAALRGHRSGRRDGRADHLYAHRRCRDFGRGDRRRARADRRRIRSEIPARRAARLPQPGQERAGSARGDPPDRSRAQARRCRRLSRPRPAPALRADLEADAGEPDGIGAARAGHRRHRRRRRAAAPARDRLGRAVRRVSHALPGGPRRHRRDEEGEGARLPAMHKGERLARGEVTPSQHFTQPPPRYTEASLVKKLEELGIGRPSTYASILQVLQDRAYVRLEKRRFVPEDRGPPRHRISDQLLRALRRVQFHRRSRKPARRRIRRTHRLEGIAAQFLARFLGRDRRHQGIDDQPGADGARRRSRAAFFPERRLRARPAALPGLRRRQAQPQARQVRRIYRLLELSELPLYPPARGRERGRGRRSRNRARHRSGERARRSR